MQVSKIEFETLIKAPPQTVFDFFSRAENLERITPNSLRFEILTPLPITMGVGANIAYKIRLFGVPIKWLTEIIDWEPNRRFVDVQRKGPFRLWEHEHRFETHGSTTLMIDTIRYAPRGWILAKLLDFLFIRKQVSRIFAYRSAVIEEEFRDT